jgi:hypothetical protein
LRDFLAYPFAPYKGSFTSRAVRANNKQSSMVLTTVHWSLYTANGETLGTNNPNYTVNVELSGVGPNIVSQQWIIQSVYIDNEDVGFPVYVFFPDTFFAVSCPPNASGWYQVFTNGRNPRIVGIGITDADIANAAKTGVYFTDALMVPYLDQEIASAVDLRLASPFISLGGTGGNLSGLTIQQAGSCLPPGTTLNVNGGGGTGGAATMTLDVWGSIATATISSAGAGYTGSPLITPSNAPVTPAAFNQLGSYVAGNIVSYGGVMYRATTAMAGGAGQGQSPLPAPPSDPRWTQGPVVNLAASLAATVSPIVGGNTIVSNSLYGASALGDQSFNLINLVGSQAVFRDNLFGTPYGSGFIHLTNVFVRQMSLGQLTDVLQWRFEAVDALGTISTLWNFQNMPAQVGVLLEIQGANILLDATKTWRLNAFSSAGGPILLSHSFTWTYNQN